MGIEADRLKVGLPGYPTGTQTYTSLHYKIVMDGATDAESGATTSTVGFSVKEVRLRKSDFIKYDVAASAKFTLSFSVFDDQYGSAFSTSATLDTATKGTITGGAGTSALLVETDANGAFECTLTDAEDGIRWLLAAFPFKSDIVSASDFDSVTFSA